MFAHDGGASALDLSHWLGPLSPSFTAMANVDARGPADVRSPGPEGSGLRMEDASGRRMGEGPGPRTEERPAPQIPDIAELRALFHTLNNQLGVILTYAELLEAKAPDQALRARATQIVTATVDALTTSKQIRATVVKS